MRSVRLFRWIWRVNALFILLVAGAALVLIISLLVSEIRSSAQQREAAAAAPPVTPDAQKKALRLGALTRIEGTSVYRAELASRGDSGSFSSGGYGGETHNILFIDFADGSARWLLPSDTELITFDTHVSDGEKPPVAAVVLAKPQGSENGRVLLFDPPAKHVSEIAGNVHDVDGVTLMPSGVIAVLYESNRRYHLAMFDRGSLAKISEREVNVPQLK